MPDPKPSLDASCAPTSLATILSRRSLTRFSSARPSSVETTEVPLEEQTVFLRAASDIIFKIRLELECVDRPMRVPTIRGHSCGHRGGTRTEATCVTSAMPREIITVQVGQCGNQIGCRFWELALKEHAAYNTKARYDEALSSFFQNVDSRRNPPLSLPVGDGRGAIRALKARAVVVDMEDGVTNELLSGHMRDVFDTKQFITGQQSGHAGSGNNWACGSGLYGPMYREVLMESVRRQAEDCDSLQGFMLLHSLGGGTGSGLGRYVLRVSQIPTMLPLRD